MKIGIDLGGSHIGIGVVDENGNIVEKKETDLSLKANINVEDVINKYITETVQELLNNYTIKAIGVASPGAPKDGKISNLVNLGIKELDIIAILNEVCNLPVVVRNDAKCAGIAEKKYGALNKYEDCVFICLGTGIGGAAFLKNELLVAKRNPGFELGHMIIEKDGKLCNCGKRGCFETYCSMKRLKIELAQLLELPKDIASKELLEILKVRKNEEKVKERIDNYLEYLIVGLSNIIDIFEPEAICLGRKLCTF